MARGAPRRTVLGLALALCLLSGALSACGAPASHHAAQVVIDYVGPPATEIDAQTLATTKKSYDAAAASVVCAKPTPWALGKQFTCKVFDAAGAQIGTESCTVGKTEGARYNWNSEWSAAPTPTPSPTPRPTKTPKPTPTPGVVSFVVNGSAPYGVYITYGSNTIDDDGGTTVPWSATLPLDKSADDYYVDAEIEGAGQLTCSVAVNGKVIQSASASGGYTVCMAEISPGLSGGWIGG